MRNCKNSADWLNRHRRFGFDSIVERRSCARGVRRKGAWSAAGGRRHGRAAFVDGGEALLDRQVFPQDLRRVLDLAAAGTREITAEEGLEHQHEGVPFTTGELLPKDIGRHSPHL